MIYALHHKVTAIVLAGGQSSRMGQDKALIQVGGVPLLQFVCQIAENCADSVYIVTPWPERYQHLQTSKSRFVQEGSLLSATGPLVGFAQGLAEVKTDWALLLACDLPNLRSQVLQEWADLLDNIEPEVIAALVPHTKGWEPLCGFYRRCCLIKLMEFIGQGGRSFQSWLQQHPVYALPNLAPEMLFNCNTPEDLLKVS